MDNIETRKINKERIFEDVETSLVIARKMVMQIEYYLENEDLIEIKRDFLIKSKASIMQIIDKYNSDANILFRNPRGISPDDIISDFNKVFEIENAIYEYITLPTWKDYFSRANSNFKQGDSFRVIVHAGGEIINLPGRLGYKKNRNFDADYISASILTDEDVSMFQRHRVGLILEPNDAILCGSSTDSSTCIKSEPSIRTIYGFSSGKYIDTGALAFMVHDKWLTGIVTKIQHPAQIMQEVTRRNSHKLFGENGFVNEVVLDDSKAKVIGIFFKTNGKEINFSDYIHVKKLEALYKVPVTIINTSIYRRQGNEQIFTERENQAFETQIEKYSNPENFDFIRKHPGWTRQLLRNYYRDVVEGAEFDEDVRERISDVFSKILDYTYTKQEDKNDEWETIESKESSVVKIEKYSKDAHNYTLFLKCIGGKYWIETYVNGRLIETVDEDINEDNYLKFFEVYKSVLEKYENERVDDKNYSEFIR